MRRTLAVVAASTFGSALIAQDSWRRLARGGAATDLTPAKRAAELFVYVAAGEADLTAAGVSQGIGSGTLVVIPRDQEHVMLRRTRRGSAASHTPSPQRCCLLGKAVREK